MAVRARFVVLAAGLVSLPAAGLVALVATGGDLLAAGLAVLAAASAALACQLCRRGARSAWADLERAVAEAAGNLGGELPPGPGDPLARVVGSVGEIATRLRDSVQALQASRDELRRNLDRLGDTLTSTHDLGRILAVILDTAVASVHAQAGALLLTAAGGEQMYLFVGRGLEGRLPPGADPATPPLVRVGRGIAGTVAATGEALRGVTGSGPGRWVPAPDEPTARSVIAVPLRSAGQVAGVLCLYDRADAEQFDESDLDTIRTFAGQAAVAIDNVLIHQEAQRLSVTDGLTGLWNYRYFTSALTREVERAARFGRPLALLMLDLDRFKALNDAYGHQRGNEVLVELAARVTAVVRDVDVVARYGGEEIALLLPETGVVGAEQLAERVWAAIRERPFGGPGEVPLPVTASLGVAVYPEHGRTATALLAAADAALYRAKSAGRDCRRVAPRDAAWV